MYGDNILNFPESTIILNAYTKKSGNLLNAPRIYAFILNDLTIKRKKLPNFP